MNNTVSFELTVKQSQLARLAIGIAIRDAKLSIANAKTPTDRYITQQLIDEYKEVEQVMYESQKEMLRKKGVNI